MKKETSQRKVDRSIFSIWKFIIFFILIALTVSFSFLLFFSNSGLPDAVIKERAPITFLNVIFLSMLFTIVDLIRYKITVERPLKRIMEGTNRMIKGDFNTPINHFHLVGGRNEFDIIIDELNLMADELASIETFRTDFVINVSHELKTPLAIISNYATLLQEEKLEKEKRIEYANILEMTTKRLSNLISNILKLNKLENQVIYPEVEEYNLSEQLCESLLSFEEIWEEKHIDIQAEIEPDIRIKSSKELLSIVWNNLISNAIKFTEAGGCVTLSLKQEELIIIEVSDTGCGMNKATGKHIFDKFYQGDRSHASDGNGLGLSLVKRVIDILGYDIQVDSEIGKGSTFTIYIKV